MKHKIPMDLFSHGAENSNEAGADRPLADRLRPKSFDDFLGQNQPVEFLKKIAMQGSRWPNFILWGPPGTGKTTLASLLKTQFTTQFGGEWVGVNAISTGAKEMREIGQKAHNDRLMYQKPTVLFIDEIHRLNKSQQDVLLPFTESGDLTLIGATTENPGFEINPALLSRCRVVVLKSLDDQQLEGVLQRALSELNVKSAELFTTETQTQVIQWADGDARKLLNMVDEAHRFYLSQSAHQPLTVDDLQRLQVKSPWSYSRTEDDHYDCISAFIKSIRGSDPDAALYYLARMIESGEDPKFIARRLVILASEDISNADPQALSLATATLQAVEFVGLPECAINLAQAVSYMACAPKSNRSYVGLSKAKEAFHETGKLPIPLSLKSSSTSFNRKLGHGKDYKYSHDSEKGFVEQDFLPEELKGRKFYEPSEHGFEKRLKDYLAWLREPRKK